MRSSISIRKINLQHRIVNCPVLSFLATKLTLRYRKSLRQNTAKVFVEMPQMSSPGVEKPREMRIIIVNGIMRSDITFLMRFDRRIIDGITYVFDGVLYKIVIPAGYDLGALLNAAGGIDLLTLIGLFGSTPV